MRSGRRMVRLWIAATVFWITFRVWMYTSKCFHAGNKALWCPAGGDPTSTTIVRTDELRFWLVTVLPSIWILVVGLLLWWALEGFRRGKDEKTRH